MSKEDGSGMSRRNLLKTLAVGGAAATTVGLSGCLNGGEQQPATVTKFACPYCDKEFESQTKLVEHINEFHSQEAGQIPKSSALLWMEMENCHGCQVCEIACSIHKEGEANPELSRMNVNWSIFDSGNLINGFTCSQCDSPECFYACPIEDAMYIDEETGARCVNEEECTGCGECVEACPFEPPRIKLGPNEETAIKCDLCSDRDGGPACLETCPLSGSALKLVDKEEREEYRRL